MNTIKFNKLLKNIKQQDCFQQIYQEFYPLVIKYSFYIFRRKALGQDIAQELFTYILTHENMPYVRNPNAWIFTLCKNIGMKYIDTHTIYTETVSVGSLTQEYELGNLEGVLDKLSSDEKEIIEQKYLYGFTLKEIATMRNRPYSAVLKQHYRILNKLRKILSEN